MNANPLMLKLGEIIGMPISQDKDESGEDEYMTFNYVDERDVLFGDDKPLAEAADMQVHLFVKEETNYMSSKKKIKEYLIEIGACGISSSCFYEKDTKKRHVTFEFEIS